MAGKPLSREELMSGELNRSRRAAKLLSTIEARCLYMRDESRRVVAAYLLEGAGDFDRRFDADYLQSVKLTAASDETLLLEHLERFALQWKPLVPVDPDLRARLVRLIWEKYGLGPATLATLGGAGPEVETAYHELFGDSLENLSNGPAGGPGAAPAESPVTAAEAWQDVETRLEWLSLVSGEILCRPGDRDDGLYVVISGRLRATVEGPDGSERLVAEIGRGELLGELEVLTGKARGAKVQAVRDSELVRLGRDDLLALSQRHLEVMVRINTLLARRLHRQYTHPGRVENTLLTYALIPCDAGVPLQDFGRELVRALGQFGPTISVTPACLDEALGPGVARAGSDDPRTAEIVAWLSELESRYRYVVYEGEPEASEWSQRCLRQADRILLIGRGSASPLPQTHETALLSGEAQPPSTPGPAAHEPGRAANCVDLVLLHSPEVIAPVGTARWLAPRSVCSHYHVRFPDPSDMAYLARCLTGHALGLVLGGGGARGFAHIGVYRALVEASLHVDLVGGTSMGAIVTGVIGLGVDWRQMADIAASISSPLKLFDPTLPLVSLFSSGKVTQLTHMVYGDALIEDLWRPIYCVSSNLTRSTETVYRRGPLWKAVRASMAIPGIFAPVLHEGDVQVDGAVMNNLPIDVMREPGVAGTVVAVNVMPLLDLAKDYSFGPALSGVRAALGMLNPLDHTSAPLIYDTLIRVMALHEVHQEEAKRRLADIYITPPVEQYNILDFGSYRPIIEAGYRAGQEALASWTGSSGQPVQGTLALGSLSAALGRLERSLTDLEKVLPDFRPL
jgi:predicted acylesterase/phospholipase RssA/CRP-like cAMP-binding protein